jgi:hypothetical protein
MKSKYSLNECVEHPITKKKLIIRDLELIDNQYIYYFDDYQCFPEEMLKPNLFTFLKNFFGKKENFTPEGIKKREQIMLDEAKRQLKDLL